MSEGGENPPVFHGEEHPLCTHSKDTVVIVKNMLKTTKISPKDIA